MSTSAFTRTYTNAPSEPSESLPLANTETETETGAIALVDQWMEEARAFLPGVRVGYIKDGIMRVEGVDIIVASVQSLRSHICSDLQSQSQSQSQSESESQSQSQSESQSQSQSQSRAGSSLARFSVLVGNLKSMMFLR